MNDITEILSNIENGDSTAADKLLPLVYEELRKLAEETGATVIHANRHYEPWWRKAQGELAKHVDLHLHDAN